MSTNAVTAIIEALSAGPKTPEQLKEEVVTRRGISQSTYYHQLKQLIKSGEVEDAKFIYKGHRVSELVISDLLRPMEDPTTEALEIELSKNLEFLAKKPGIALSPLFLMRIEQCLTSKLAEVRLFALEALSTTLGNLTDSVEDKKARETIITRFYDNLVRIVSDEPDTQVRASAIRIFPALGDPRAIDIFIEILEKYPDDKYSQIENSMMQSIVWPYDPNRRPRNYLTRDHHPQILLRLSELSANGNKRASKLADAIRHGGTRL